MEQKTGYAKYIFTGALSGFANGFFGTGGGIVLVPLLIRWVKLPEREAFATSVFVVLPMCMASAAVYFFRGGVDLNKAAPYLAGGFLGGVLAGCFFKKVPVSFLRRFFGAILLYGGIRAVLLI